ncbi:MAG: hypothetical protein EXS13_14970 [Planctomycetes bacterium]|nr:hypothetical protein [Planctomycetota bacterium]
MSVIGFAIVTLIGLVQAPLAGSEALTLSCSIALPLTPAWQSAPASDGFGSPRSSARGLVGTSSGGGYGGVYPRARTLRSRSPSSGPSVQYFLAPGASPTTTKPVAPAAASAIDPGDIPGSKLPPLVLSALESGPLTAGQAKALVELLVSRGDFLSQPVEERRGQLDDRPADPDILQVVTALDGKAATDVDSALVFDAARLRAWFVGTDSSGDAAISFLEWRDRTSASLKLFREFDTERNGLLAFNEFALPILLNIAREGSRKVDPELLNWAVESNAATRPLSANPTALESLDDAAILTLARAHVAEAAAKRAALNAAAQSARDRLKAGTGD